MSSSTVPAAHGGTARRPAARWLGLIGFLVVAFAAGWIGAMTQGDDVGARYLAFEKPVWAPPQEAFGIVWPILYVFVGVAGWRVWKAAGGFRAAAIALGLWGLQLVLNATWPGVFFGEDQFGPAVIVIIALDIAVLATITAFRRHDRIAAAFLLPYLAWILYATALNIALWQLN